MSDFCAVGLSIYTVKAAKRFINLDWPEPEPFGGGAEGETPESEARSSGPDINEEKRHAA